jgi:phage shock protein A
MVTECAEGLRDAEEALRTTKESFAIELEEAAALDAEVAELYNLATAAVQAGNDDDARRYLTDRKRVQGKLDGAKLLASEAKGRVARWGCVQVCVVLLQTCSATRCSMETEL